MKIEKEIQDNIQELQVSEQAMQNVLLQKQAFQMELNETSAAFEELEKTKDEVYKIAGQIMLKSSKDDMKKELSEKKKIIELRLKSIEKQESLMHEKTDSLRQKIEESLKARK